MAQKPVVKKPAAPAPKQTLFDELTGLVGYVPDEGEAYQDFAVRLGVSLSEVDDETYGKLSPAAVKWFTAATDAINADKEAPALPGFPEVEEVAAEEAEQEAEVEEEEVESQPEVKPERKVMAKKEVVKPAPVAAKPAVKPAAAKPAAKPAPAAAKKPAAKPEATAKAPRKDGVAYKMRVAVVKNPNLTFEAACTKFGVEPVKGGHAWNSWYTTVLVMREVAAQAA